MYMGPEFKNSPLYLGTYPIGKELRYQVMTLAPSLIVWGDRPSETRRKQLNIVPQGFICKMHFSLLLLLFCLFQNSFFQKIKNMQIYGKSFYLKKCQKYFCKFKILKVLKHCSIIKCNKVFFCFFLTAYRFLARSLLN